MRRRLSLATAGLVLLAGCATTIPQINERPAKFYQRTVSFTGRIARSQELPGERLLEIADANNRRILVRVARESDVAPGDWVKVTGVLVPEARIGDTTLYDVVTAEAVHHTRAPRFPDLF